MKSRTKRTAVVGMFCALAYAATAVGRIPIVLFLKYDPKDVVIVICGFIFGPLASFVVALAVSLAEMVTISESGVIGLLMNIISSSCFACTAASLYKRRRTLRGAVAGLLWGWGAMISGMLLWNYLIAPIYMGYPREVIAKLLFSAFLPFNFIKGGVNAAMTIYLYKPVVIALRRSNLIDPESPSTEYHKNFGVLWIAFLILAACVWLALDL